MDFQQYIRTELLILIPVLYLVGMGLKKSHVADHYIPLVLGVCSIILCALWVFATQNLTDGREMLAALFTAVTQGVLTAGTSVYISQLYIQSKKDRKEEE